MIWPFGRRSRPPTPASPCSPDTPPEPPPPPSADALADPLGRDLDETTGAEALRQNEETRRIVDADRDAIEHLTRELRAEQEQNHFSQLIAATMYPRRSAT